ncbi:MAG: hypothetical protein E4H36_07685 [Spirochaetales bacterium]|nr:MAG: hypothetical protein E4H36_07685 [Spirochaetales bacterium]
MKNLFLPLGLLISIIQPAVSQAAPESDTFAGETEVIPEMSGITNIDITFLPMNQPYTMTPEQAAEVIKPKVLYPYHFGDTDTSKLVDLLKGQPGIEFRIRKLQ